ncbi:hypothetical protein SAMD00019534_069380, partial [Acytostelium subglobosum LB1]|uniref:hypothetical protein n=1 Tax=Acytostelium subglobosum LB1 TaxID=1410327 RepID=UPI0006451334
MFKLFFRLIIHANCLSTSNQNISNQGQEGQGYYLPRLTDWTGQSVCYVNIDQ